MVPTILFEDAEVLVIEKPAGMLAHETAEETHTLDETVAQWARPRITDARLLMDRTRAGVVHRLDAGTSGVMVIAKTAAAAANLEEQFRTRKVKKEYVALVHGRIDRAEGTITFPLSRATSKNRRGKFVAKPESQGGRTAVTHFVVQATSPRYTLLAVHPETGRTHQIRAHLTAYGHPIVGDAEYRNKRWKDDAPRLMLHARRLGFTHPTTGQWVEFQSPIPEEFQNYLNSKMRH